VAWQGYCRVAVLRLRHRRFDGGWSEPIEREITERAEVAAVVPYDPLRDEVVLIRQFRPGAYVAGRDPWLWEIVAGVVDAGESLEAVAGREAQEEAGLVLADLIRIYEFLPSPGAISEVCTLFAARVDAASAGGTHGLASEGEHIAVEAVAFGRAMAMLADGGIRNGKTIIGLQWLALNRAALRQRWS
jgi:ADP-ribose pyrophosphatase